MKFIVTGADRKTGRDSQLAIAAATTQEAERIATEKGMLVASVKPVPGQMATDISTGSLPIWDEDPATPAPTTPRTAPPASPAAPPAPSTSGPPAPAAPAPGTLESQGRDAPLPASARYHVIQNPALYLLEAAVNKHMKEGWEPLGGIQVSYAANQLVFYQSMVRKGPGE